MARARWSLYKDEDKELYILRKFMSKTKKKFANSNIAIEIEFDEAGWDEKELMYYLVKEGMVVAKLNYFAVPAIIAKGLDEILLGRW